MYTKKFNRQSRRVNRRLNKTGIRLAMDINKRKNRWHSVYMIENLCKEEKNAISDILHDRVLRKRYITKLLTRTR